MFGTYLALISLMVLPITSAGLALFEGDASVAPDSIVLALPLAQCRDWLALAAYVGGFSAATGVVIVASVALATMGSNERGIPPLLRPGLAPPPRGTVAPTVAC